MKYFFILISTFLIIATAFFGIFIHKRYSRMSYPTHSSKERTLAIIKPDAVKAKHTGAIISLIEKEGFTILPMKKMILSKHEAETFYAVHAQRPFFPELVKFMTSGPVVVMVLEKENAITDWRKLMGATNPAQASEGTIRKLFGTNVQKNAAHGSDSPENALLEINYFFPDQSE